MLAEHTGRNTARQLLTDWANEQDGWVRLIVNELLVTRSSAAPGTLRRALETLLAEKGLTPQAQMPPLQDVQNTAGSSGPQPDLRLLALDDVSHVNALSAGQEIKFHPSLTILFGENATGKSGYCRILKRLANVRSAEQILDDVESTSPGTPTATIKYSLGDDEHELKWDNTPGVRPFGRMAIFDSRAVGLHVDDDLNFQYTPGDLVLFSLCHAAIDSVRALLERRIEEKRLAVPLSPSAFNRGTEVFMLFESLGPATDEWRLKTLGNFSETDEKDLRRLQLAVAALQPENLDNRAKAASADIDLFEEMLRVLNSLIAFDTKGYTDALQARATARQVLHEEATAALSHAAILGQSDATWRAFIDSAERFVSGTHPAGYPQSGDKCPYCQQGLTAAAASLIRSYRRLVRSEAQKKLDACVARLASFKQQFSSIDVESLQQRLSTRMASVPESSSITEHLAPALTSARSLAANVSAEERVDGVPMPSGLTEVRDRISNAVEDAKEKLKAAQTEAEQREVELAAKTAQLRGLEDRQTLAQNLMHVLAYLEQARWEAKAAAITKLFSSLLRSLTAAAKQASAVALHEDFEARFTEECERLRAPKVKLDFPGRRGEAARRKVVAGKHRVSDILSEGEQKVIALADFLAEASFQEWSAPVVLDDPVNSLDYRRIYEVVARLGAMSRKQQLVVFTHNIWFASLLLEEAKKNCLFYQVRDDGRQKGLVSLETAPRTDSLKGLKKTINEKIQEADSASGTTRQALVESAYGSLRAWCEVAVERQLLQEVVTRYQPMVRLTSLDKIKPDALKAASATIVPVYERCCRAIEAHSQPLETLSVRPTLEELRNDWRAVQTALKGYEAA